MLPESCYGIGAKRPALILYLPHRPEAIVLSGTGEYGSVNSLGVRTFLADCDNHWRKIFNCYAKIAFALFGRDFLTWQDYRDNRLLTEQSLELMVFPDSKGSLREHTLGSSRISIISGIATARKMSLDFETWKLLRGFYLKEHPKNGHTTILTPYFDYRQLSNQKIETLLQLLKGYLKTLNTSQY